MKHRRFVRSTSRVRSDARVTSASALNACRVRRPSRDYSDGLLEPVRAQPYQCVCCYSCSRHHLALQEELAELLQRGLGFSHRCPSIGFVAYRSPVSRCAAERRSRRGWRTLRPARSGGETSRRSRQANSRRRADESSVGGTDDQGRGTRRRTNTQQGVPPDRRGGIVGSGG